MSRVVVLLDPLGPVGPSKPPGGDFAHLVRIARALGDFTVLAIASSSEAEEASLHAAIAAGAQRVVALWDGPLETTDYYGTAQALAAATRKIGFDVVVCSDGRRGLIGPALADQLGIPHLASVVGVERRGARVVAHRAGWGTAQALAAEPPLLLSLATPTIVEPLADVVPAPGARIERFTLADVGISPAEVRWRKRFAPQPAPAAPARRPRLFGAAADLAARLVADGLLAPPTSRAGGEEGR